MREEEKDGPKMRGSGQWDPRSSASAGDGTVCRGQKVPCAPSTSQRLSLPHLQVAMFLCSWGGWAHRILGDFFACLD